MKPLREHNRHWNRKDEKTWEDQARKYASAFHRGAMKSGVSARNKLYQATHGEFTIPKPSLSKGKAILLIILIGVSALFLVDQVFKAETGNSPLSIIDPSTIIWRENSGSFTADFNYILASYGTGLSGYDGWQLQSNSSHASVVLTKTPIDMGITVNKLLTVDMVWGYQPNPTTTCGTLNCSVFGWYFTRNGTVPLTPNYVPMNDANVALVFRVENATSGTQAYGQLLIQRDSTKTINQEAGACQSVSSCFLDTSYQNVGGTNRADMVLNYTGTTATGGNNGRSVITLGPPASIFSGFTFPPFQVSGQAYYLGFFQTAAPSATDILFYRYTPSAVFSMDIYAQLLTASAPTPPQPEINTGGFFGPIIKALVSIGVFMLKAVSTFLGFIADAFVTAMNAVGSFFGLGPVGTAIRNFLTGVANFIINVVTTVFGWGVTFASLFQNGISFIANFLSGSNSFISFITSFFSSIAGLWTIIQDLWTALNSIVFTIQQVLVVWYFAGMFWVYMDGWFGFKNWIDLTDTLILKLLRGGWWVGREVTQVVLDVKRFLVQWL